ncbi:zinc finger protein 391-like [Thrips palmi]|uniref:Zinc finger protein 391-like n=1 Tax=Thrips palmi TaxID=161013 RepID=A0A6P8ZBK9_THRPL|nr:zinc finger protein 391-like [Thrips palmi]
MFWDEGMVCRLCLISNLNASSFYELFGSDVTETSSVASKLFSALKWKVHREDGLSKYVCMECVQQLDFIIFCNTWSSKVAVDFEEVQSLSLLHCKQTNKMARSHLFSIFERRNSKKIDPALIKNKFNAISLLVSQIESILSKSDDENLCFTENENNVTDCMSLDIEQYCSSPAVDNETYPPIMNECPAEAEVPTDLELSSNPEDSSNLPMDDGFPAYVFDKKEQLLCPECQVSFPKRTLLWKHLMSHEGAIDKYQCSICRKKFISTCELSRHIRAHKGLKPYKCSKCSQYFSQKNLLDNHLNWHEGRKGHLCDICGECLSSGPNLKAHISNRHSMEKQRPFKCNECGKCFARSHHLENHITIHTECRSHLCTTCGVAFKRYSQLQEHENVHSAEKQFKCDECNKCFWTKRVLKVHKLVHSDLKPHQCSQCSKSFVRLSGLQAHLKTHKN